MADNFSLSVTSGRPSHLKAAIQMAMDIHTSVVGWAVVPTRGFVLYWSHAEGIHQFPVPLKNVETLVGFVRDWLELQDYGAQPDHDGSNSKGFTVYNESWGHVNGQWQAFVAIKPEWMIHGK